MNKKIVFIVCLLMTFVLISNVLAIETKAKIGSGIMILRASVGDSIERSILVINDNNFSVNIALTAFGDLKDDITIKDSNFTLQPSEEKKAYFTIDVKKAGETKSRINVLFTPVEGKTGVGLSSTITVIANGTISDENTDNAVDGEDTSDVNSDETNGNSFSVGMNNKYTIPLIITGIVALIFIVLLIIYYSRFKKKNSYEEEFKEEKQVSEQEKEADKKKSAKAKERVVKTKPKKRVKRRG